MEGRITEIFSSIQGEGVYVGQPQILVRFKGCNLDCDYCDTPARGGNAQGVWEVARRINELSRKAGANVISLTGGEPLLQTDFLKSLIPQLKKRHFKIYLETNGTLPHELERILRLVNIVAMDVKLPSSQKRKTAFWSMHRDFLKLAARKDVFVKVVVTDKTTPDEIKKVAAIIDDINPLIPLVLQPVTPARRIKKRVTLAKMLEFQKLAKKVLNDVRVIPQVHKTLGIK
ncbi:MAG: 7-carboxy-7-deazaguanine synthase QueE [Candidatus Omnitrophica bacterium]|nr:7-carboxy-7-deazaguanine synthase QueE [Candidatus Omnitrophota bacterium]